MSVLIDMDMPRRCIDCRLSMWNNPPWVQCQITGHKQTLTFFQGKDTRPDWCPLREVPEEIDIPIFDKETRVENCTVQILENTKTGRVSIGWWRNDEGSERS